MKKIYKHIPLDGLPVAEPYVSNLQGLGTDRKAALLPDGRIVEQYLSHGWMVQQFAYTKDELSVYRTEKHGNYNEF